MGPCGAEGLRNLPCGVPEEVEDGIKTPRGEVDLVRTRLGRLKRELLS